MTARKEEEENVKNLLPELHAFIAGLLCPECITPLGEVKQALGKQTSPLRQTCTTSKHLNQRQQKVCYTVSKYLVGRWSQVICSWSSSMATHTSLKCLTNKETIEWRKCCCFFFPFWFFVLFFQLKVLKTHFFCQLAKSFCFIITRQPGQSATRTFFVILHMYFFADRPLLLITAAFIYHIEKPGSIIEIALLFLY